MYFNLKTNLQIARIAGIDSDIGPLLTNIVLNDMGIDLGDGGNPP